MGEDGRNGVVWSGEQGKGKGWLCTPNVSEDIARHTDTWTEGVYYGVSS